MVFAHVPLSRGELQVAYDEHARVLSHNPSVHGLTVTIQPDSFRYGVRPNQPR